MICEPCKCDAAEQRASLKGEPFECKIESCSGHDSCKGCDCQHRPVMEGQIVRG